MNKVIDSPEEAIADLGDGATIAITGFGTNYAYPTSLKGATIEKRTREL